MSEKKTAEKEGRNVFQRISDVMSDVGYLQKDKDVAGQYKSVSFGAFAARVREAFLKHGIIAIPIKTEPTVRHLPKFDVRTNRETGQVWKEADCFRTETKITFRIQNIDVQDDYILVESFGAGIDGQDKDPGKAFTYALKSALMRLLLIETGEGEESSFASREVETVDGEQVGKIRALCVEGKIAEEKIAGSVGVETIEDIPAAKFEEIVVALNQRIARVQEKAKETAAKKGGNEKTETAEAIAV